MQKTCQLNIIPNKLQGYYGYHLAIYSAVAVVWCIDCGFLVADGGALLAGKRIFG